ncbi:response regulator transcription factor [Amycolatopsis sp. cg5]|uniref:response regulator transcription factor n=1 Tax=Amycolatopsis sp. cg5 TaxID=3238802 RepID=UPI003524700E
MEPVRVAVWTADPIMHAGLTSYLRTRPELTVAAPEDLTERDVLVVHIDRMTPQVVAELRGAHAHLPKVLLAGEVWGDDIDTAAECRAVVVLPCSRTSGDQVVEAVLSVRLGRGRLPADPFESVRRTPPPPDRPGPSSLTTREVDMLRLLAEGYDTAAIADKMRYSERTVKNTVYALTKRLNLKNRPHAVAYAMRAGVI